MRPHTGPPSPEYGGLPRLLADCARLPEPLRPHLPPPRPADAPPAAPVAVPLDEADLRWLTGLSAYGD